MKTTDYEKLVHTQHVRLGFRSGNCRICAASKP